MLNQYKNVFLVGIGGIAMFNLAIILKGMGKHVSGSDSPEMYLTDVYLKENNIPYIQNFDIEHLPDDTDLVVYTGAHQGVHNPQVKEAEKRGITTMSLAEINKELTNFFTISFAVSGTHGKTTTASLLAFVLSALHEFPSYLIGTATFNKSYGGNFGRKKYFVIEADEYGVNPPDDKTPKFHLLNPTHVICTNIDYDHPDIFANIDEVKEAFLKFFKKTIESSPMNHLFVCADDKHLTDVMKNLPKDRYETYGFDPNADMVITNVVFSETKTDFDVMYKGEDCGTYTISLFGKHNVLNAGGVILSLIYLGFDLNDIREAIIGFTGAKRRFEQIAYENDIYLFDDYAHQPSEVRATVQAAKNRYKNRRIIVIFQPHTYSRTAALKEEFVEALEFADYGFISPIYASAREKEGSITSEDLVKHAQDKGLKNLFTYHTNKELMDILSVTVKRGDVVFTMGAGDIYTLKDDIINILKQVR